MVETAVLLCIVGVVLAVAIPTFVRTVQTSKVAEASAQLRALLWATSAYYARVHETADGARRRCLPLPAGPAPEKPSPEPTEVLFDSRTIAGAETWRALAFQPDVPIQYRYSYLPKIAGCSLEVPAGTRLVTVRAEGDLDGDDEYSTFERTLLVAEHGGLVPDHLLSVRDRVE